MKHDAVVLAAQYRAASGEARRTLKHACESGGLAIPFLWGKLRVNSDGADRMVLSWSILVGTIALTASGSALAQVALDDAELRATIVGRSATLPDGSVATWHASGAYSYTRQHDGRNAHGRYTIVRGRVCLDFFGYYGIALGTGWVTQSCDRIIRHSDTYVLMDSRGRLFKLLLR